MEENQQKKQELIPKSKIN